MKRQAAHLFFLIISLISISILPTMPTKVETTPCFAGLHETISMLEEKASACLPEEERALFNELKMTIDSYEGTTKKQKKLHAQAIAILITKIKKALSLNAPNQPELLLQLMHIKKMILESKKIIKKISSLLKHVPDLKAPFLSSLLPLAYRITDIAFEQSAYLFDDLLKAVNEPLSTRRYLTLYTILRTLEGQFWKEVLKQKNTSVEERYAEFQKITGQFFNCLLILNRYHPLFFKQSDYYPYPQHTTLPIKSPGAFFPRITIERTSIKNDLKNNYSPLLAHKFAHATKHLFDPHYYMTKKEHFLTRNAQLKEIILQMLLQNKAHKIKYKNAALIHKIKKFETLIRRCEGLYSKIYNSSHDSWMLYCNANEITQKPKEPFYIHSLFPFMDTLIYQALEQIAPFLTKSNNSNYERVQDLLHKGIASGSYRSIPYWLTKGMYVNGTKNNTPINRAYNFINATIVKIKRALDIFEDNLFLFLPQEKKYKELYKFIKLERYYDGINHGGEPSYYCAANSDNAAALAILFIADMINIGVNAYKEKQYYKKKERLNLDTSVGVVPYTPHPSPALLPL